MNGVLRGLVVGDVGYRLPDLGEHRHDWPFPPTLPTTVHGMTLELVSWLMDRMMLSWPSHLAHHLVLITISFLIRARTIYFVLIIVISIKIVIRVFL